ncbi:GNAT family N-acetyltransferase [Halobacillus locisalis]|uniref:GNAT family N-acetyltransferase n=1 Tax=Halobacillus locisalis TaxID=220753 RepID=A0A838CXM9_9BACI|nr:GNAT family N-acetyltransferase [Halobacillus locisalis]MBA2176684.1 GNAT family N-acetyltransferase [Halobacillus locisalis]
MAIDILSHRDPKVATDILKIQQESYAVEAELINFSDIPPFRDSVQSIVENDETFIGYMIEEKIVGVLAYKEEQEEIDIYRMMVDPAYFRRGIGESLLKHLFATMPNKPVVVQTGKGNEPAVNLYLKYGFEPVDEVEVEPDVWIVMMKKAQ